MKSKNKTYRKLIQKIFMKVVIGIIISFSFILTLAVIGRGKAGDIITSFISEKYMLDWYTASNVYWMYFRKYIDFSLIIGTIIIFLIFFRVVLYWFTKYFDEIINGVNNLASNSDIKISMSPELEFMSDKLNQVKADLERSARIEREAEKRKSDLLVYLAHDIKTPLTSVIGYLSLIDENHNMCENEKNKYIDITLKKAYRLESLVNEFFEVARYNSKSVPLNKEIIDLSYMMVQVVDELYPVIKENEKEVKLDIPLNINIYADAEKIARVFNNLLKNAIHYSESNEIKVSAIEEDKKISINFENIGTIPQDKLGSIFEKFYRVDEARQTSTGGFGLGLAIVKDIIELHMGNINVKSENNKTIFTIKLKI